MLIKGDVTYCNNIRKAACENGLKDDKTPAPSGAGVFFIQHIIGDSKQQTTLLPGTLNNYVDEDHPVRVIDALLKSSASMFWVSTRVGTSHQHGFLLLGMSIVGRTSPFIIAGTDNYSCGANVRLLIR